jgi:hypothetical protein
MKRTTRAESTSSWMRCSYGSPEEAAPREVCLRLAETLPDVTQDSRGMLRSAIYQACLDMLFAYLW